MDHTLFIHSFISGHLGCLELVATVNNAAMNVGVQIPVLDEFYKMNIPL